jgi:hypothetical protein
VNGKRVDAGKIHSNFSSAGVRGHAQNLDEDGWCRSTKFQPLANVVRAVGSGCLHAGVEAARPHFTHIVIDAAARVRPLLTAFGFKRHEFLSMTFVLELGGKRVDIIDVENGAIDLMTPSELSVRQLKQKLSELGQPTHGRKRDLSKRLRGAQQEEQEGGDGDGGSSSSSRSRSSKTKEVAGGSSSSSYNKSSNKKRSRSEANDSDNEPVANANHAAAQKAAKTQAAAQKEAKTQAAGLKAAQLQAVKNQAALKTAENQTAAVAARLKALEGQLERSKAAELQLELDRSKAEDKNKPQVKKGTS